uniref:Uncharacterized protein n=1 Tax=Arion vulgaris TaxID=1028688 RepID=A0A0B6ZUK2_9EUPU
MFLYKLLFIKMGVANVDWSINNMAAITKMYDVTGLMADLALQNTVRKKVLSCFTLYKLVDVYEERTTS